MTDKQVGELWRLARMDNVRPSFIIREFVQKLVDERQEKIKWQRYGTSLVDGHYCNEEALRSFEIDPATWPKPKLKAREQKRKRANREL